MKAKSLLIIGLVWPEPSSSAAGWRMLQLIQLFKELEYQIIFASAAQKSERSFDFTTINVAVASIELNSASFDRFIKELSPDVVMFDRFISEEQFGWRVSEQVPSAIRILDAEDFHGLRKARELALKQGLKLNVEHLQNDLTKRELVSMYRCDLTLVISEAEIDILSKQFQFPEALMLYIPFLLDESELQNLSSPVGFEQRNHLMTVGNFLHPPNADAVDYLKKVIWPQIRAKLPNAELHIYGAYETNRAKQYSNTKDGYIIKGTVPKIAEVMSQYRVCLAPLRFGAGLKGKLFDAMKTGTPAIMTNIAAEGLFGDMEVNGIIEDDALKFSESAVKLYLNKELWQ
ncbi:MAG: glycosyltransferase family 4 protein, partial [Bacteroidota bacterium]